MSDRLPAHDLIDVRLAAAIEAGGCAVPAGVPAGDLVVDAPDRSPRQPTGGPVNR